MNIFSTLNKANENIMEYYSPQQPMPQPMQQPAMPHPMQQPAMPHPMMQPQVASPMAFGGMQSPIQRPISMPSRFSEKKKDDDDTTGDILKMLAAAGMVGGGGYMMYNHFKEPAWKKNLSSGVQFAGDGLLSMLPGVINHAKNEIDKHDNLQKHTKKKSQEFRDKLDRGEQKVFRDRYGNWLGDILHNQIKNPDSILRKAVSATNFTDTVKNMQQQTQQQVQQSSAK